MFQPGRLIHRITLQHRSTAQDPFGQQLTSWVDLTSIWAEIAPLSGSQLERMRSLYSQTSHRVVVRWQPILSDVRQVGSYRILYASRIFDIGYSLNELEQNILVTLLCSEGLNEGS